MQPARGRGLQGRAGEWCEGDATIAKLPIRLVHPFPSFVVAGAGTTFAVLVHSGLDGLQLARLFMLLLSSQFAVGALNDFFDAEADRLSKPEKPIPAGRVSRRAALWIGVAMLVPTAALALSFGPSTVLLATLGTGAGIVYDAWLKRTVWSWAPYVVGLPLLPLIAWSTGGSIPPAAAWAYPIGALLAFSLHLANALPDHTRDQLAGVQGLVQYLGRSRSQALMWLAYGAAVALSAVLMGIVAVPRAAALAAMAGMGLGTLGGYLVGRNTSADAGFAVMAVGSAVLGAGLMAGIS